MLDSFSACCPTVTALARLCAAAMLLHCYTDALLLLFFLQRPPPLFFFFSASSIKILKEKQTALRSALQTVQTICGR
jgi:hypothetical protein